MAGADKTSGRKQTGHDQEGIRRGSTSLESGWRRFRRGMRRPPARSGRPAAALGQALRLGIELVAGVAVGGFIGWALDRFFGTAPLLMVVFLVLGAAAGIMNVMRTAKAHAGGRAIGKGLAGALDDDDD